MSAHVVHLALIYIWWAPCRDWTRTEYMIVEVVDDGALCIKNVMNSFSIGIVDLYDASLDIWDISRLQSFCKSERCNPLWHHVGFEPVLIWASTSASTIKAIVKTLNQATYCGMTVSGISFNCRVYPRYSMFWLDQIKGKKKRIKKFG